MRGTAIQISHTGDALIDCDSETFHVAKVLPGEKVILDHGRLRAIISASPERVEPFCAHYAQCGGCKFQHWQEGPYRAWKRQLLVNALAKHSLVTSVSGLCDAHGEGRRRASLHVRHLAGTWCAGFMAQKSHDLTALAHCPVLVAALQDAPRLAASFGPALGPCNVAITAADNGLAVAVKAKRQVVLGRLQALNDIAGRFGLIRLSVNGETYLEWVKPVVRFGKAEVELPVASFLQATRAGEEVLAQIVQDAVGPAKRVADLFCGAGPFALRLAARARVTAIDSHSPSIESLKAAMRNTQGLRPMVAQSRDLFREPLTVAELKDFDAVVLDPPRAGAEAQAHQLAKSTVRSIIMVACDARTFARDAAILVGGGYTLREAVPIDQFKWTAHLEMVGVFRK